MINLNVKVSLLRMKLRKMRKVFLILLFYFTGSVFIFAFQNIQNEDINFNSTSITTSPNLFLKKSTVINTLDTVVFDLSQFVQNGIYINFPVSILSDDSIYSLDFSFKFNNSNFTFDSIYDLVNYFQSLSYYNSLDSVVRYTSSSFQQYEKDKSLVSVSFILLSGSLNNLDLSNLIAYLNGIPCSIKIIYSQPNFIPDNNDIFLMNYFPNPSSKILKIESISNITIQLLDICGREVFRPTKLSANQILEIDIHEFIPGIYFLRMYNKNAFMIKKVIIQN